MNNGFTAPEIEQAAISAMVQWPECRDKGLMHLKDDHFFSDQNRRLFDCVRELSDKQKPIELISFTHWLREKGTLELIGGAHYVTQTFVSTCYSPRSMDYYIEILSEELSRRMLLTTCAEVAEANLNGSDNPVEETIQRLEEIPTFNPLKEPSLAAAIEEKMERMERREQDAAIVQTGIAKLDYNSPLWISDMPLISGERKAGKSILALSIALNVARKGIGVAYFSLEDSERKVVDRLLSGLSRVPLNKQDHVANLSHDEVRRSAQAADSLKKLPIYIHDKLLDLQSIVAAAKSLKQRKGIGLIVVDYGQLVRTSIGKDRTREQEVAHVSRTFRLLAMELNTPLILLSQLNADGFTRESRALEQDSTAMWKVETQEDEPAKRWINIPWQRNGESNIRFPVTFIGQCARIENYQDEQSVPGSGVLASQASTFPFIQKT